MSRTTCQDVSRLVFQASEPVIWRRLEQHAAADGGLAGDLHDRADQVLPHPAHVALGQREQRAIELLDALAVLFGHLRGLRRQLVELEPAQLEHAAQLSQPLVELGRLVAAPLALPVAEPGAVALHLAAGRAELALQAREAPLELLDLAGPGSLAELLARRLQGALELRHLAAQLVDEPRIDLRLLRELFDAVSQGPFAHDDSRQGQDQSQGQQELLHGWGARPSGGSVRPWLSVRRPGPVEQIVLHTRAQFGSDP